ncbi:HAD family hydrolase [Streptomyces sp. Li-HN-5-11]|uniref:D-glycero-alpha-D-manno-heptose-1,7-bisphosphate 7-phosphatase n=1 Tax=Streptomyces sp. Li-HN-5-11 TaxID=3075432 RepID=UPI0028A7A4BD|nr:HAD family hydrolase [Streptomyces sp. Li-HN-5-11]WNM31090.1 HAD family hydrolase [Streptomyces sp. Li-HN-5-11]
MNPVRAVLFDRDGTLVEDVPYNGDPERVRPVAGAREAVRLLREKGIGTGVVTNQSGVARGMISAADVRRVNERVDELLGPFDVWAVCPHGPDDGCRCRKPRPGMILWAAGRMCTEPSRIVVIGDIGADMEAARRAGAHGMLVPTPVTRPEETAAARHVARDLLTAVRAVLAGPPWGSVLADERPIEAAYRQPGPAAPADRAAPAGCVRPGHRAASGGRAPGPRTRPAHDDGRRPR